MSSKLERRMRALVEGQSSEQTDFMLSLFQKDPEVGVDLQPILDKLSGLHCPEPNEGLREKIERIEKAVRKPHPFSSKNDTTKEDTEEIIDRLMRIETKLDTDLALDAADLAVDAGNAAFNWFLDRLGGGARRFIPDWIQRYLPGASHSSGTTSMPGSQQLQLLRAQLLDCCHSMQQLMTTVSRKIDAIDPEIQAADQLQVLHRTQIIQTRLNALRRLV